MKTIRRCTPLFLMFAMACDDMNASIEVNDEVNSQRSDGDLNTSAGVRAGYLVKATRAVEAIAQNSPEFLENEGLNCETIETSMVEEIESACADMPEMGYTVELGNCFTDGGDTFDATLIVSAPKPESLPFFTPGGLTAPAVALRGFEDWKTDISIDSGSGANISACGLISRSPVRTILDYSMTIEGADSSSAQYDVLTRMQNGFGRQEASETRLTLVESSHMPGEPHEINIRTRDARLGNLLPHRGVAQIHGMGPSQLHFRRGLSTNSLAQYRSLFSFSDVVEIPTL
jgi:hypothetical protein